MNNQFFFKQLQILIMDKLPLILVRIRVSYSIKNGIQLERLCDTI